MIRFVKFGLIKLAISGRWVPNILLSRSSGYQSWRRKPQYHGITDRSYSVQVEFSWSG